MSQKPKFIDTFRRYVALVSILLSAPAYAQTLTIEPAVAKPGQAIVGTLSAVPDLPDGAIDVQVALTLEGGDSRECNATEFHFWPTLPKSTATWKRTAHVPVLETYFAPGPGFNPAKPRIEDLILKQRVVSDTPVEQVVTATVVLEGATPPEPPKPDVLPGKRQLVVIRESATLDPSTANILASLRVGDNAKWLKERGHTLTYYDPDDLPAGVKSKLGTLPVLPALFVIDASSGVVVAAQTLPVTVEKVKELVTKGGG